MQEIHPGWAYFCPFLARHYFCHQNHSGFIISNFQEFWFYHSKVNFVGNPFKVQMVPLCKVWSGVEPVWHPHLLSSESCPIQLSRFTCVFGKGRAAPPGAVKERGQSAHARERLAVPSSKGDDSSVTRTHGWDSVLIKIRTVK